MSQKQALRCTLLRQDLSCIYLAHHELNSFNLLLLLTLTVTHDIVPGVGQLAKLALPSN